jgi:fucokinase
VSHVHGNAILGDHVVLSYIDVFDQNIPDNVVLHGLKQRDGRFVVRIYGVEDNPKGVLEDGCRFLENGFSEALERAGVKISDLWEEGEVHSLWTAKLYPACKTIREALDAALNLYELIQGAGNLAAWKNAERKSLCSGFNEADPGALIAWDQRMAELVQMERLQKMIRSGAVASEAEGLFKAERLTTIQNEWYRKHLQEHAAKDLKAFSEKIRLHYFVGTALGGAAGDQEISECFKTIGDAILTSTLKNLKVHDGAHIAVEQHTVQLPLRVNWGGGWSDTPPYCNENGGTVLNAAILLNGEKPVTVQLEKIEEKKIVFDSRDMDVHGEFAEIAPLQQTGDPYDPFALQKAALLACGIIPLKGGELSEILTRLGGGFIMRSEVTGVPKGSGLGTSSILAAASVKALLEFMGIDYSEDDLYSTVLCMEQIMSTGGGWQDQVGGITGGIKYITTRPGIEQEIQVEHVSLAPDTTKELKERFVLIYTGQRRLARNLLRDVVGNYIGNKPESLYALNEIQRVAALMRFELERGHVDDFAKLLSQHWELSKQVDAGSTNTLIDQIFDSIDDLVDGRMICGAGGGGFLQCIAKKHVTGEMIHKRLKEVFQDSDIDVWDCELV